VPPCATNGRSDRALESRARTNRALALVARLAQAVLFADAMGHSRAVLVFAALLMGTVNCTAATAVPPRGGDGGNADPALDSGGTSLGGDDGAGGEVVGRDVRGNQPGPSGNDAGPMSLDASDAAPTIPDASDAAPPQPEACDARAPAMHRPQPETCPSGDTFPPDAAPMSCSKDADCTDAATTPGAGLVCFHGQCSYDQCATDQDCPSGDVCSCKGNTFGYAHVSAGNSCVPANCRSDADCGPAGRCAPTVDSSCGTFYGVRGYYCHSCNDTCTQDSDCAARDASPAGYCAYDLTVGHWVCSYGFCAG
jgi:hypothetical protein